MIRLLLVATEADDLREQALPVARHLIAQGWIVDGMARNARECDACVSGFSEVWNAPWSEFRLNPMNLVRARQVADLVIRKEFDLVHVRTPRAGFLTRLALRNMRPMAFPRVVYTASGRLSSHAERLAAGWTDHLVTATSEDLRDARQLELVANDRIHFIPKLAANVFANRRAAASLETLYRRALNLHVPVSKPATIHQPLFRAVRHAVAHP